MDFIDQIKLLSKRVEQVKDQIQTEEATKMSLIMPLFQTLGYDVFNPMEFVPEYTADVGIKKGEKVDYAILTDGEPTILVEAKWCGEPLDKHGSQLFRYFTTTKAKFGILTNGVEYRFFTDLDEPNKMDEKPFFIFDITQIKEQDINELKKFHKANFNIDDVFSAAEDLKYTNQIKVLLKKQLNEPDDNFINYVLNETYDGRKTQTILDKFKPVIKKSFNTFVNDLMSDRLNAALNKENVDNTAKVNITATKIDDTSEVTEEVVENTKHKITTTQEELDGFAIVKAILHKTIDVNRIFYRDTASYFGILCDNKNYKWICRLRVETSTKYLILPDGTGSGKKCSISNINDIFNYENELIESAKRFVEETTE
ncbi:type I restriction endonuclease [Megamonas funiformis]|uniref:type I restriction endonuclease n=1 Tax=Megamonas funiformis TaxID=437897 RepID=UPI00267589E8|nr:type I restriction endonuclease [Megamonas funiformis]